MSYKKKEHLTLIEHLSSPPVFGGVRVAHLSSVLCCHIMCLYVLSSVLCCWLRFPHKSNVRFVFISSCLVVSNTYCVVFLFCYSSSCITYVSLDCSCLIALWYSQTCIHDLNTSLNYLSSNVLSLYCIFDVLCLTRELIKFIDYKIMLKLQCKATLILPLLEKNHQNRTRVDLGIMFFFKCGFI